MTCPFTTASFLIGAENLVRLTMKNPEAVHLLCRVALESAIRYAEAIIDAGCTPSLTDPMSSSTVISPRLFKEFSLPYLKRLIEFIHLHGKSVTLHICGKTEKVWEAMADAGADCISIDNDASLSGARESRGAPAPHHGQCPPVGDHVAGHARPMCAGRSSTASPRPGIRPKGYIIASGCSLPTETPFANIQAMMDAAQRDRLAGGAGKTDP